MFQVAETIAFIVVRVLMEKMELTCVISIIVPVFKVEEYLDECVRSVLSQSDGSFELILVDDGSPDRCPQMCDEWKQKDPRIVVIHKANGGLSDARNVGLHAAQGDYVWFVDSDDWIATDAVENIKKTIYACSYPDVVVTQLYESKNGIVGQYGSYTKFPDYPMIITNQRFVCEGYPVLPSVRYIMKKCFMRDNKLAYIKGILHEDLPFSHMLISSAKRVALMPEFTYYYRIREGSIARSVSIRSCYSLIIGYKALVEYINTCVSLQNKLICLGLTYDYFHEIFIKLAPFIGKKEYACFMAEHGEYLKEEFGRVSKALSGKRKLLYYVYRLSPTLYARLLYWKKERS